MSENTRKAERWSKWITGIFLALTLIAFVTLRAIPETFESQAHSILLRLLRDFPLEHIQKTYAPEIRDDFRALMRTNPSFEISRLGGGFMKWRYRIEVPEAPAFEVTIYRHFKGWEIIVEPNSGVE